MPKPFTRSAVVTPATINESDRTVRVVWSTGAAVRRVDMDGPFLEVLSLDPKHVNLSRLQGASVLDAHQQGQVRNVLGVLLDPKADGAEGTGTVKFSSRPDVEPLWQDVKAGILRHLSVGYTVEKWADSTHPDTGERIRVAVAWTPFEISFVPTPADPGATVRSKTMPDGNGGFQSCPNCTTPNGCKKAGLCVQDAEAQASSAAQDASAGEGGASANTANTGGSGASPSRAAPGAGTNTRAAINQEIRTIARVSGLPTIFADNLIDQGASAEDARAAAFTELARRSGGAISTTPARVEFVGTHDSPAAVRAAMSGALAARLLPGRIKPEGRAREFMGFRLMDMAAELALANGQRFNRFNQDQVLERMHTTADFPLLLQDAGNKILLAQYQAANPSYRRWAARRPFNDFKPHKFLRVGDFPGYQKLAESGEVKYGTMSENREVVTPDEYATGIVIGRRALINDDLSALSDFSSMIAIRTAADENRLAYSLLENNGPVLSDGKALFDAAHGNKAGAGAAINVTSVGAGRAAMRKQTSLDGIKLNIEAALLITSPDKELEARQVVANVTAAKAADVNPWAGKLDADVDANITGNRWYLFADPAMCPVAVYGYVGGAEGPQIKTETDFDTQAIKVRAGIDFAVGVIDFRGAYFNPGQE